MSRRPMLRAHYGAAARPRSGPPGQSRYESPTRRVEHREGKHPAAEVDRQQGGEQRTPDPGELEHHLVAHEDPAECAGGSVSLHQALEREASELGRGAQQQADDREHRQGERHEREHAPRSPPRSRTRRRPTSSRTRLRQARGEHVAEEPADQRRRRARPNQYVGCPPRRSANASRKSRNPFAARRPAAPIAGAVSCGIAPSARRRPAPLPRRTCGCGSRRLMSAVDARRRAPRGTSTPPAPPSLSSSDAGQRRERGADDAMRPSLAFARTSPSPGPDVGEREPVLGDRVDPRADQEQEHARGTGRGVVDPGRDDRARNARAAADASEIARRGPARSSSGTRSGPATASGAIVSSR